jgi:hypothetical protein
MRSAESRTEKSEYEPIQINSAYNESLYRPETPSREQAPRRKQLSPIALILVVIVLLAGSLGPVIFLAVAPSLAPNNADITTTFENFLVLSKEGRSAEAFALLTPELQAKTSLAKFEQNFTSRMTLDLKDYQGVIWQRVTKATVKRTGANFADVKGVLRGINDEVVARLYNINGGWRIELFYVGQVSSSNLS